MPTTFDVSFRALAQKLVAKFGVSTGTYTLITHGTMNDDTNKVEGSTTNAQVITMSPPVSYKKEDIDGSLILSDDFKVYIAAPDFETAFGANAKVQTDDIVLINGITARVIEANPIYSGEQVAAYAVQLRRGQNVAF